MERKFLIVAAIGSIMLLAALGWSGLVMAQQPALDRTVLPIPDPTYPVIRELDARDATPPPRFEVKAPKDAPNMLIVLLDDMGFGQPSTFGGPITCRRLIILQRPACAITNSM